MPILHIHGVSVRGHEGFKEAEPYLRRIVAPAISKEPKTTPIHEVYWGDAGVKMRWAGSSRPRTRLLGMGAPGGPPSLQQRAAIVAELASALGRLSPTPAPSAEPPGRLTSGHVTPATARKPQRLKDLDADTLSNVIAAVIKATSAADPTRRTEVTLAADAVAHDPETLAALAAAPNTASEVRVLIERLREAAPADATRLVPQGAGDDDTFFKRLRDGFLEFGRRVGDAPAYALSIVTAELRPKLNDWISLFLGDVFVYLHTRGTFDDPGVIPKRLLDALDTARKEQAQRAGEPIVVISHSMGGQIVFDALTYFLPNIAAHQDTRIDFWCATASQVGFFLEAGETGLFAEKFAGYGSGNPIPFPSKHLGGWWNVWDYNDFLSFTIKGIVQGVIDEPYDSGMSLAEAHSGYFENPSFYRTLAAKLEKAKAAGWKTV